LISFIYNLLQLETLVKLTEVTSFDRNAFIVPIYGISQDPDTKSFILVLKYIDSNFQNYCKSAGFDPPILSAKLMCILNIRMSLSIIHSNNLVHRDLHVDNIFQDGTDTYISDFGLSKPASESDDKKIYGKIPYMAPEVLRKKPYTEKSDIYSLGIIINTIISGELPFNDREPDRYLMLDICRGLRPEIRDETPQVLKELNSKMLG